MQGSNYILTSAIKRRDVSPLNGAPHAITAGCYSADRSPSPIKTRVKATLLGGLQERKTEDCRKKNREGGEEENRGEKPRAERDGEKKKQRRELEQKKKGRRNRAE